MEQKWTKEPWVLGKETKIEGWSDEPIKTSGCYSLNSEGWAQLGLIAGGARGKANAQRIVDCVNAMAGIDEPAEWMEKVHDLLYRISINVVIEENETASKWVEEALALFPSPAKEEEK